MARTIAKDHESKRRLILARAARLFAEEGFDRASVSRVAEAAGISKSNVYHYYTSKDDVLFDILDSHLSMLRERVCGMDLDGLAPAEALRATLREVLMAHEGADDAHRIQSGGIAHLPPERQAPLLDHQRALVRHLSLRVEAIAPEVFAGDARKLRAATMSIFGMLNWFYMWSPGADRRAREDHADLICRMCLRGIPGL